MNSTRAVTRTAFTLVELVISAAVAAVLMVGLATALMLASRALPDDQDPMQTGVEASMAVERFASDLWCALSFTERTPTAATFTVSDRDTDGNPEIIRYAWSGTAGMPLTRSYNGGPAEVVVDNLSNLALTYNVTTIPQPANPLTPNRYFIHAVDMSLQVGSSPLGFAETSMPLLNRPEVSTP